MGDFGSGSEAMRIIDLFALEIFAKNLGRCNFRLLQHYQVVDRTWSTRGPIDANDVVDDARSRRRMCQRVIVEQRITGGGRPYAG
jgi:hypothetical protein